MSQPRATSSAAAPAPLQALTQPLVGSHLIEASAGTGKTWTIAALYLRLVLGHGGVTPRAPAQILVMSFTTAATRELAVRIRKRLVQAARALRGEAPDAADPPDEFLRSLVDSYAEGEARTQAAWRAQGAAQAMDDAAVLTIDAWCQRVLREHAFASGGWRDEELLADETALAAEAVRDYWRQQVYPLPAALLEAVARPWSQPEALERALRGLPADALPPEAGQGTLAERLGVLQAQMAALRHGWRERVPRLRAWLETVAGKGLALKIPPKNYHPWLNALQAWADGDGCAAPSLKEEHWHRLSAAGLRERLNKKHTMPALPEEVPALEQLHQELRALPRAAAILRAHAAARVAQRRRELKAARGSVGFEDLQQQLADALDEARHGERAAQLRRHILADTPVALVDEFQDTSPLQLRLFDRLWRIADNDPQHALLLIGDPKQAIYGFRGADIHSYLRARRATAPRHHALAVNRRSTHALVEAVNVLFGAAEARPGAGAFAFGRDEDAGGAGAAVEAGGLPFHAAQPHGRAEALQRGDAALPAFTLVFDGAARNKDEAQALAAALAAEQIVHWLNDPAIAFVEAAPKTGRERLQPHHIAVLVRDRHEAEVMRRALRRRGVASAYLSDRDSVFATAEAPDLLRLLRALAAPRDLRLMRAALATRWIDRSEAELAAALAPRADRAEAIEPPDPAALPAAPPADDGSAATDDAAAAPAGALLDEWADRLRALRPVWAGQGVLALVRALLAAFGLPARWLRRADGERRLTNALHLAELLQAASHQVRGEQGLIHWLAGQIDEARQSDDAGADEPVMRLESDADLVQVVSVHKSKGLEYPLVFVPFAAQARALPGENSAFTLQRDAQGERHLNLQPDAAARTAALRERLREDLRLLYVALTRARHALWVGAALPGPQARGSVAWHHSALGYLLGGAAPRGAAEAAAEIEALQQRLHAAEVPAVCTVLAGAAAERGAPGVPCTALARGGDEAPLRPAQPYRASFDRNWSVASYSALVRDARSREGAGLALPAGIVEGEAATGPAGPDPATQALSAPVTASTSASITGSMEGTPAAAWRDDDDPVEDSPPALASALVPALVPAPSAVPVAPWHQLPRGALLGNLLHGLLEWLADEGFALEASPRLQQALRQRCQRAGWGHHADAVLAWMQRLCRQPLPMLDGATLPQLALARAELEFWLPSDGLAAGEIDALCCRHLWPQVPRPVLPERRLHGLLMGFADLVFQHQGRYWVLDYKSNALGPHDADYGAPALAEAMRDHRYDVQAVLYLLALHRLLRARLGPDYRPAQQLGGAVFWFLRGVGRPEGGALHLAPPWPVIDALDAALEAARDTARAPAAVAR